MPSLSSLLVFGAAAFALLIIPGPAVIFVTTRSMSQGWRAGLVTTAGLELGSFVHVVASAMGLSAVLARSSTAFNTVKWAGAVYLVIVGVRRLTTRSQGPVDQEGPASPQPLRRLFVQGLMVNVLNPKVALFFLAFLPQFVHRDRGPAVTQIMVLGALFCSLGMLTDGTYATAAAALGQRLRTSPRTSRVTEVASGVVFVGLGVTAALTGRPQSQR